MRSRHPPLTEAERMLSTAAYVRDFSFKRAVETVQKDQRTGTLVTVVPITAEQWLECYPQIHLFPREIVPLGNVAISMTWLVTNVTDAPEFQWWFAAQTDPHDAYSYSMLTMPSKVPFGEGEPPLPPLEPRA